MRRPALLAFGLFALAASLPAEIRQCLPMAAACEHRARGAGAACPRASAAPCAGARVSRTFCPKRPASPAPECRLHPTPEGAPTREPLTLVAPVIVEPLVVPVEPRLADASGERWIEPPLLRPRASPREAPLAPRPPPLAA